MKLLLLSSLISASVALCPYGATYYAPDNICYLTTKLPVPWTSGESICRNLGGHLANIKTQQQNDFVHLGVETLTSPTFVGVYYNEGEWKYSDGTVATFTNFEKGAKPTSNHSVALMVKNGGKWQISEDKKDVLHPFVCEIPVCNNNIPVSSTLDTTSNNTGLKYGPTSNSWYYGTLYDASTIEAALSLCESAIGNLPTIRNGFENSEFVEIAQGLLGDNVFYEIPLGYRSSATGSWYWDDGNNSTYTNWAMAQPLIVVNARTIIRPVSHEWYTRNDFLNRPYVCQFRINPPTVCA